MIKPITYFEVRCNHCCRLLYDGNTTAWPARNEAVDAARRHNWWQVGPKNVLCNECAARLGLNSNQKSDQ